MAIYRCQTASQVSLFAGFLIFVDQPTYENHENWYPTNKSDFTVHVDLNIFYNPTKRRLLTTLNVKLF
jgi:hypothetical protein